MHGVGAGGDGSPGPGVALTQGWMSAQWALQKQILARMRALGIVPILPAFQGNVPPLMKTALFPGANISVQARDPRARTAAGNKDGPLRLSGWGGSVKTAQRSAKCASCCKRTTGARVRGS